MTLQQCASCGLVYANPQPRERILRKYTQEYDLAQHFGAWKERKAVLYRERLAWLPGPAPGAARLCDVGCGDGQFLALARELEWTPFGIDMNPPAVSRARERGIEVALGMLEETDDLPWGTFDLVTAWDCLEHSPAPIEFMCRLRRLLAPGGTLALSTLNVRSLVARSFGMRWSMVTEDHFTYWDKGALIALTERCGLEVGEVHTFGLGRDFVRWVDRFAPTRGSAERAPADGRGRRWDTTAPVLCTERVLNRLLDRLDGGVGIRMIARHRISDAVQAAGDAPASAPDG